jgi:ferredoxin
MLEQLQRAYEYNLVQFGENVRNGVNFICNCCPCCCEALVGARRFSSLRPIYSSSFLPQIDLEKCNGCGKCARVCPVEAVSLVSSHRSDQPRAMAARLDSDLCLGCGVCVRSCPQKALTLVSRPQRISTPYNTTHRLILMAIEKGQFQDLIFDNQVLWSQRTLAALLGAFLKLPPVKQVLASRQVKSRFFEALIKKTNM